MFFNGIHWKFSIALNSDPHTIHLSTLGHHWAWGVFTLAESTLALFRKALITAYVCVSTATTTTITNICVYLHLTNHGTVRSRDVGLAHGSVSVCRCVCVHLILRRAVCAWISCAYVQAARIKHPNNIYRNILHDQPIRISWSPTLLSCLPPPSTIA